MALMLRGVAAALALLAGGAAATGGERVWRIDPEASVIAFDYEMNGRPQTGFFHRVSGLGVFDPEDLRRARLTMDIVVDSLELDDPVETAFALSMEWFDASNYPMARYRLARLEPLRDGRYDSLGDLTIKDRLKIIRIPIALSFDGDEARATGSIDFDRRDFNVGFGASALFVSLGTQVSVRFDIVARALDE